MIHVVVLVFTLYKSTDRRRSIVLLLNYAGFAYIFEYIVVALFNGYVYKPRFLKNKSLDNIFGAICSQFFYVPVIAMFISAFGLGWKVKVLFSFYFALIEKLFIRMDIYKNNWWRTRYTFGLILLSFSVNDKWNELLYKQNPTVMYVSLFNMIQVTWMNIIYTFAVLNKIRYGFPPFFSWKEHFRVAPVCGYLISFITTAWIKKGDWFSYLKLLIPMSLLDIGLLKKSFLKVNSPSILATIYSIIILTSSLYRPLVFGQLTEETDNRS